MDPITLRLPPQLADELEQEAEEDGFSSRSEYIRHLLHHRDTLKQDPPIGIDQNTSDTESLDRSIESTDELLTQISGMEDRINELEDEVANLQTIVNKPEGNDSHTSEGAQPESSSKVEPPSDDDSEITSKDEFATLNNWLQENGPQSDDAQEIMLAAAQILESEGPLKTGELKERLSDRYPDTASYSSLDTLWTSTVERLYEDTPGFERPKYGTYNFDITQIRKQVG
jgi:hypothetical protein